MEISFLKVIPIYLKRSYIPVKASERDSCSMNVLEVWFLLNWKRMIVWDDWDMVDNYWDWIREYYF